MDSRWSCTWIPCYCTWWLFHWALGYFILLCRWDSFLQESVTYCHFSAAKHTDGHTANNYHGELLGGLLAALILKAAFSLLSRNAHPLVFACDNIGVVIDGNDWHLSLREAQSQGDLIRCFWEILSSLSFQIVCKHMYGNQDKNVPWESLTLLQQLNVIADQLAKEALWQSFTSRRYISSNFPLESFQIIIGGCKVTSSIHDAL